jgi:hypothetical protein
MSIGGVFLLLAFIVGVGTLVIWPLLTQRESGAPPETPQHALTALQAQREAILIALRDLDFDYQTGKLIEADYQAQRDLLMERGAVVLREIDAVQGATP